MNCPYCAEEMWEGYDSEWCWDCKISLVFGTGKWKPWDRGYLNENDSESKCARLNKLLGFL